MFEQKVRNSNIQKVFFILITIFYLINLTGQQRTKRFLTFPRTSPTRVQVRF